VTPDIENDQTLRRYFLGELPRHKHRLIEKSFFEDDRLFDRMLSTEERLIAEYVRGALPERERLRFESYFLTTPQRQQRVRELSEAEGVKVVVPPVTPQPVVTPSGGGLLPLLKRLWARLRDSGPMLQVAFAVITLAILGALWATFIRLSRPSPFVPGQAVDLPSAPTPDVAKAQTPQQPDANNTQPAFTPTPQPSPRLSPPVESATPPPRPTPRENATPPSPTGTAVAVILSPGLMRGGSQAPSVKVTPDTPTVHLKATLTEKVFERYSATLLNEEKRRVRRWGPRSAQEEGETSVVVFDIPAKGLADGYYYLLVSGVGANGAETKVDTYPFEVEHR
jgi:hypothetical protein